MGYQPGRRWRGPGFFPFLEKEQLGQPGPFPLQAEPVWSGQAGRAPWGQGCPSERQLPGGPHSKIAASGSPAGWLRLGPGHLGP